MMHSCLGQAIPQQTPLAAPSSDTLLCEAWQSCSAVMLSPTDGAVDLGPNTAAGPLKNYSTAADHHSACKLSWSSVPPGHNQYPLLARCIWLPALLVAGDCSPFQGHPLPVVSLVYHIACPHWPQVTRIPPGGYPVPVVSLHGHCLLCLSSGDYRLQMRGSAARPHLPLPATSTQG